MKRFSFTIRFSSLQTMLLVTHTVVAMLLVVSSTAVAQSDPAAVFQYYDDLCQRDDGQLWGRSLCGPMIIVDPASRKAWTNQPDPVASFVAKQKGVWQGDFPNGLTTANTAFDWHGEKWTMVLWPLPLRRQDLAYLLMHEAWHRIQDDLKLSSQHYTGEHLATQRARYLMRLEMRALHRALGSQASARIEASRDALAFRAARYSDQHEAAAEEFALDRNEGLASYTGVKLGVPEDQIHFVQSRLMNMEAIPNFVRSYAYATGPAYGILLDEIAPDWRLQLSDSSPADLLSAAVGLNAQGLEAIALAYDGKTVAAEEEERAKIAASEIAALRQRYAEGPRLILPLNEFQMDFDPNAITPIENLGTYYQTITLRDQWGELKATAGALIDASFAKVIVVNPSPIGRSGPGWVLKMAQDWELVTDDDGAFQLVRR